MTTRNEQRATNIERMLIQAEYTDEEGSLDWFSAVGDLLADLRHLADHQGFDFEAAVEHSNMHYETERRENNYELQKLD